MSGFCHCHLHGEFSLLDGCGSSEDYAHKAKDIGQDAFALTDHGNLAGALYHLEACDEVGIKPIIGMEAYFKPDARGSLANGDTARGAHLLLLAKNSVGFHNLMRLSSAGFGKDRFYYAPIVDWELLYAHHEGLIATSGCVSAPIPRMILGGRDSEAEEMLDQFLQVFGDDFYMEIQPHDFDLQHAVNRAVCSMAKERGVPLLATVDTHYVQQDWFEAQDTVILLGTGSDKKKRAENDAAELEKADAEERAAKLDMRAYPTNWMMSEQEVREHFAAVYSDLPFEEAMANTVLLADSIEHVRFDKSPKVPSSKKVIHDDRTPEQVLRDWCEEGLAKRGLGDDPQYRARIEEELHVFKELGAVDYFVIIGDMVRWAKSDKPLPSLASIDPLATKRPIRVGACRGSAGASLILYLIGVTALDPIGYDLLFQRFMSEAQPELPDVDIDFAHNRREEVVQYLIETYGQENVAYVAAFQSFGMKSVITSVSRALNIPYDEAIRASKDLDDEPGDMTLEKVIRAPGHDSLKAWKENHPEAWRQALILEGQIKGKSKHAAAVVITDRPVPELMPTMQAKDETTVTQWSARANAELIQKYGFLKIDVLATEGLTVQQEAIDLIRERHGVEVDFEDHITHPEVVKPTGEESVCHRFTSGQMIGVFQFGKSDGIVRLLRDIKPTTLDHLIAANALYRPGPIAFAHHYWKRKNGKESWELVHPKAEKALGRTYGVITFQEQVMQLVIDLANFDPSQSYVARKVIAKGVVRDSEGRAKLDKLRSEWLTGTATNGISTGIATALWDEMLEMCSYSFNRAHAAGYALQAYQDMWLKEHYPIEFYAAMLTWDPDKGAQTIREARANSIDVLPPDINESQDSFALVGNTIRFGLRGVKHVGEVAAAEIMGKRPFASYDDFEERIIKQKCNIKVKTALKECGAFDRWGMREDLTADQRADAEIRLIGFAPSRPSDLAVYRDFLLNECDVCPLDDAQDGEVVNLVGEVISVKKITTKKGDPMAFVKLWFEGQDFEASFFSDKLEAYGSLLHEGEALLLRGKWQEERNSLRTLAVERVRDLATFVMERGR